ncbi:hypothetical protein ACFL6T_00015 [Candidatus Zixiibacteriota bacterium]
MNKSVSALVIAIVLLLAGCGEEVGAVRVNIPGIWEGYISQGSIPGTPNKGDLTLTINNELECTVEGFVDGSLPEWGGEFHLEISGLGYVDGNKRLFGAVKVVRTRPGSEPDSINGTISGEFNLVSAGAFGDWFGDPGELFNGVGLWTVIKDY